MIKYLVVGLSVLAIGFLVLPTSCQFLEQAFGPEAVTLEEAYGPQQDGETYDHAVLDGVLSQYVEEGGWVDYQALSKSPKSLDRYITSLAAVDFDALSRDEKLALLINAYNAFTLRLILDHMPLESIRDIPESERWEAERWQIGDMRLSLLGLENDILRSRFKEPRMHFAINCASVGCPPLRSEAYRGADIDRQLEEQAAMVHQEGRWFHLDTADRSLDLSRLYLWYESDFEQVGGSVLSFAARHSPALAGLLGDEQTVSVDWLNYDWSLNHVKSPARR